MHCMSNLVDAVLFGLYKVAAGIKRLFLKKAGYTIGTG